MDVYLKVTIADEDGDVDFDVDDFTEERMIEDLVDEVGSVPLASQCVSCECCDGESERDFSVSNVEYLDEADLRRRFGPGQVIGATTGRPQW